MPIRISKVYTRAGDGGKTRLGDKSMVSKADLKLEVMGTLDELNCWVGAVRTRMEDPSHEGVFGGVLSALIRVQNELFDIGSQFFAGEGAKGGALSEKSVQFLEEKMDQLQAEEGGLPVLSSFVLPGGSIENTLFHLCRTVCRRAERRMVQLQQGSPVDSVCLSYINRLSDFFFVLSRYSAKKSGIKEYLWENGLSK